MANQITTIFSSGVKDLKQLSLSKKIKLAGIIIGFLVLTVGLSFASKLLFARVHIPVFNIAWVTYLIVLGTFVATNLIPFGPAPIALSILFTTAPIWNPLIVGLAAAIGASIGGLGGYLAGVLGRKILLKENFMCNMNQALCNENISNWIKHKGPPVIGILALQPFLPFEITGIIAGSLKMSVGKFFIASLTGNAIKYIALSFMAGMISSMRFFKF
ncbi:MAG: VTT domain-containing protein [Dehalococcoidales bacterium]